MNTTAEEVNAITAKMIRKANASFLRAAELRAKFNDFVNWFSKFKENV